MSRNYHLVLQYMDQHIAPREGRVSRNRITQGPDIMDAIAPREGRVSRNQTADILRYSTFIAPREGRVSRNTGKVITTITAVKIAPREGRVSRNRLKLLPGGLPT